MITLKVEPYCEECQYFSPDATIGRVYGDSTESGIGHVITCYDAQKCRYLKEMFKQFEKETK